ncbi:TetR/AcrR family transcriptional regulator [Pseudohoeflea suaedae]|uniref:TetR/AcrR family transcriptional regulator n=1 Tax=Pseudohoeflea suaedae TaxID=877384 RepID=A0A4R5PJJ0_9HYPH|nr:TetR/AcrR family transcriptional regulator [Pseudohoeflea suaedae]TDH35756.1 TetR/AcrR family transcriptional regulator [Pseudohoeflea suaedae]
MARTAGSTAAETVARLKEASLDLFAREGYAAVSMRAIAACTGVQAGAIYNYFPTKQDILVDLLAGHMQALEAAWQREEGSTLADFVRFHVRYHLTRPREMFISYMELRSLEPANFTRIRDLRRGYEAIPRQMIEDGIADGKFDVSDPEVTTRAIIALLNGLTTWYREDGRLSLGEIETVYIRLVNRMVGAREEEEENV